MSTSIGPTEDDATRSVIEGDDIEAKSEGMCADRGKPVGATAAHALDDYTAAWSDMAVRGMQGMIQLVLVGDVEDPCKVGGFAIRRYGVRPKAAYLRTVAMQEGKDNWQGAMPDDGDVGGRRQVSLAGGLRLSGRRSRRSRRSARSRPPG